MMFLWLLFAAGGAYWLMQPKAPKRLVLLGDSLAVGMAPFIEKWAKARGVPLRVDAKVGRPSTVQEVGDVAGAVVLVSQGTNDAVSARADVRAFAKRLAAGAPARVIWLVPPGGDKLPGIANVRAQIRSLSGVTPITVATAIRPDGLHPVSYSPPATKVLAALVRWPA